MSPDDGFTKSEKRQIKSQIRGNQQNLISSTTPLLISFRPYPNPGRHWGSSRTEAHERDGQDQVRPKGHHGHGYDEDRLSRSRRRVHGHVPVSIRESSLGLEVMSDRRRRRLIFFFVAGFISLGVWVLMCDRFGITGLAAQRGRFMGISDHGHGRDPTVTVLGKDRSEENSHDKVDDDDDKSRRIKWTSIPPNSTLTWHPCFPGTAPSPPTASESTAKLLLDCARLQVPMDWSSPPSPNELNTTNSVILSIIRRRANPDSKTGAYLGPLFMNPGGPGGSGIYALLDHGEQIQTIVGDNHDLVSWDPRGVGASLPRVDCWGGGKLGQVRRQIWELGDPGVVDAHEGVFFDAYARAGALSGVCESRGDHQKGEMGILRHVSTPYHARDLLEILDQMGGSEKQLKLRYWGFSYGTVLGGTFAAMWPDRVERMVNDGNVDYKEWYTGSHFKFLQDADRVMHVFYVLCHSAGPDRCAFYEDDARDIKRRLDKLLEGIKKAPVVVNIPSSFPTFSASNDGNGYTGSAEIPELVTYSKVKRMISTALYQPILRFRRVAQVLAALEEGNGLPFYEYTMLGVMNGENDNSSKPSTEPRTHPATMTPSSNTLCPLPDEDNDSDGGDGGFPPLQEEDTPDASPAIMCSDAMSFTSLSNSTGDDPSLTLDSMQEYYTLLSKISKSVASVQISFKLSCVGRTIAPVWKPFNLSHPFFTSSSPKTARRHRQPPVNNNNTNYTDAEQTETKGAKFKTAHPILFIANRADNVTPLVSAIDNSGLFEDSVVLVQADSWGHTTLAAPSVCTAGVIRRYFQEGRMPGDETGIGIARKKKNNIVSVLGRGGCKGDLRPFIDDFYSKGSVEDGGGENLREEGEEEEGQNEEEILRRAIWKLGREWRW